jgi:hypothetical protein
MRRVLLTEDIIPAAVALAQHQLATAVVHFWLICVVIVESLGNHSLGSIIGAAPVS